MVLNSKRCDQPGGGEESGDAEQKNMEEKGERRTVRGGRKKSKEGRISLFAFPLPSDGHKHKTGGGGGMLRHGKH